MSASEQIEGEQVLEPIDHKPSTKFHAAGFQKVRLTTLKPVPGFEIWTAVWANKGRDEVVISAGTLDGLIRVWKQITKSTIDIHRVQHTVISPYDAQTAERWR